VIEKQDLRRLLDYTEWANHRVVRVAATLELDAYRRDLGASHGGVRGTLAHVLSAEWVWLERFKGNSPPKLIDEGEFPDILALKERWAVVEAHRRAWFDGLKERAVNAPIRYRTTDGRSFEAPLAELVQHVVNHSSYHRGQLVCMFRDLGARPVSTDLVLFDRERATREATPDEG
jgi:uncharacterized damage-inducible protein DinB